MKDVAKLEEQLYALMNMLADEEHLTELMEKNLDNKNSLTTFYNELKHRRSLRQNFVSLIFNLGETSGLLAKSPNMSAWCSLKHQLLTQWLWMRMTSL